MSRSPADRNRSPFLPPLPGTARPGKSSSPPDTKSLSKVLQALADDPARARISIADLVAALQLRAIGALLLIFALPNALPAIPGTSGILGLPLIYLTFQLMLGQTPWLPGFITNRSLAREDFGRMIAKITPLLARAERLLAPRLRLMTTPGVERAIGALCFVMSVILFLPIPLGNMLPAFAISVIALGLLERDGVWILVGSLIGLASIAVVWGVAIAMLKAAAYVIAAVLTG